MKSLLRILSLSVLLLMPFAAAYAQAPTVSLISDVTVNAGVTQTVNVVAVGTGALTLTSSLPAFATLNAPTSGTGVVSTTITLAPTAGDVGTHNASVTATSGSLTATESFVITVNAEGSNQAPVVVAPAIENVTTGSNLTFTVTATDAEAITSLAAATLPTGATFTANGTNTSGTFSWTPTTSQTGEYDVVFTAANSLSGSATTHIHVGLGENHAPTLSAPATQTVTEGVNLAFTVTASDVDGDHVTLTTGVLPSGASATDQGNNTLNFSWTPTTSQSGTYTVTFNGDDGHGGTVSASTVITVLDSGGGGGGASAKVVLIGQVNTHSGRTCFRITPINSSFDVRNVTLTSITLGFNGQTVAALSGSTHLQFDCDEGEGDEGGDCDSTGHHEDAARLLLGDGHPRGEGDDNDDCEECDDDEADSTCAAVGIKACFSTDAVIALFGDTALPGGLADATVQFTLSDGTVVVATIDNFHLTKHENNGKKGLNPHAKPNPLNPRTELTFTLSRAGRVQVAVYDAQGRLVNKLLDEVRDAGPQTLTWDGSDSKSRRVSSGVYFFRIQAAEGKDVQRVAVVK